MGFDADNLNSGHRQRVIDRFMQSGLDSMADYEKLELMLFASIQRRDVKPLAKQLLLKLGSLAGVLDADPADLLKIKGVGERTVAQLKLYRALLPVYLEQEKLSRETLNSGPAVADFVRLKLGGSRLESCMIIYLNNQNKLICYDVSHGTVDRAAVYPRNVAKRALELGASAVIMAHNHPGGDAYPSNDDAAITKLVADALKNLDIRVLDHVVVTAHEFVSMAAMGLV